jgi:MYXO-CTERM domain-containing protein
VYLVFSPQHASQAGAMVTAAGLFGIGHGIRRRR